MTSVLNRLSDKLVRRLVPRTTATACVNPQASWFEYCYCGCIAPGDCRHIWKECSVCGGVTGCSKCIYWDARC